ncbi:ribonuclease H-like domain-containing protein [Mycena rebaudengoi]|nr:ribonuclease H-like domain-containing protein [Mycena rebaudengoi]
MGYHLHVWVDGACRRNGRSDAVGGVGVWFPRFPDGNRSCSLSQLDNIHPTNQRAELYAIIVALRVAHEKQLSLVCASSFTLHLNSDSRYAVDCMTAWLDNGGWINAKGLEVCNKDLIQEAAELVHDIERDGGNVNFCWIPRGDNSEADNLANQACDRAERLDREEEVEMGYYSSSDSDF